MSKELWRRAEAHKVKALELEAQEGSGYHDHDRNKRLTDRFLAPQRNGLPKLSDHLVFFTDRRDHHFVAAHAEAALKALKAYHAKISACELDALTGTQRRLLRLIPKLAIETVDEMPRLTLELTDWNAYVEALYEEGVGLSGAPMIPDGTTPG